MKKNPAANRAIERAGGPAALALALLGDVAKQDEYKRLQWAIAKWRESGVPARWAVKVEALTGVPRYELRPDVFPRDAA